MAPAPVTAAAHQPPDLAVLGDPTTMRDVLSRWDEVVRARADHPAFVDPVVGAVSFAAADDRARAAAGDLTRRSPGEPTAPVGALVDHTVEGLLVLLTLMRAGRVFVPLDPHLPVDRLRQIVVQSGMHTLVTDAPNATAAAALGDVLRTVVRFDDLARPADPEVAGGPADPEVAGGPDDPGVAGGPASGTATPGDGPPTGQDRALCVVFTSGSTGTPKGVVMTHGQLLNDAYGAALGWELGSADRVALVFPYGFAAGVIVIFSAILNGAGLWAYDPRDRGAAGLADWIGSERLTALFCAPHLLRSMVATMAPGTFLDSLRTVTTAGEVVYGRDVAALLPHLGPDCSFTNWLGSSEVGGLSAYTLSHTDPLPEGAVPVGLPMPNTEVRIVGADGGRNAAGEVGEVVIVSRYLSGGYWRDATATAARFTAEPDGRSSYRTGDLGLLDADGHLVLRGRLDAAVKIRGFLVEPSEIEAALLSSDSISEAAVLGVSEPPAPTRLVAYVAPDPHFPLESPAVIRRRLRSRLPEYMVPQTIVTLASLPHNERGKVDRRSLPAVPPFAHSPVPTDRRELLVADLWSEVLGLDHVGRDDDFAELGGDSLAVEEVLTLVQERFGVTLLSSDVLEAPTVGEFAARVLGTRPTLPTHPTTAVLRSAGTATPLFYFAGAGALGLSFSPVMRHLPDRRVYAFQARGLESRALPDRTVDAAVRRHLEMIRVLAPHGPYVLAGHSFGGLLALETAHRLTAAGEEVELVALLDTFPPSLMGDGLETAGGGPTPSHRPGGPLARVLGRVLPDGLPPAHQWPERALVPLAGVVQLSGLRQFTNFFNLAQVTARRHVVAPYSGRTVVFLTEENIYGPEVWASLLNGPTTFHRLDCEHNAVLREPFATAVAAAIQAELPTFGPARG